MHVRLTSKASTPSHGQGLDRPSIDVRNPVTQRATPGLPRTGARVAHQETIADYARSNASGLARTAATPGQTGLPGGLKSGIEALSGVLMDDVRVHRNSAKPARLQALAHTQGSDIHLGPGEERQLPHEAWHVVQQKQGRVRPTMHLEGTAINDEAGLEHEADTMGARAAQASLRPEPMADSAAYGRGIAPTSPGGSSPARPGVSPGVVQRAGSKTIGAASMGLLGGALGTWLMPGWGTLAGTVLGGLLGALGGHFYDRPRREPDVHWKFYLNPQDFARARNQENPGGIYDMDKSPGYQESMIRALREEVFGNRRGGRIDYQEYTRLHDLVTSSLRSREGGLSSGSIEHIRTPSSVDEGTAFPINDWSKEKIGPAQDLMEEMILGMPMMLPHDPNRYLENDRGPENERMPSVTTFVPDTGRIHVRYSEREGQQIVEAILNRYYREIGEAGNRDSLREIEDAKLTAIVKAIRALHVTHPFKDANGRLHAQLMLNRFLSEQGFSKTIMPEDKGLGVFGGAFSIDQLKRMVRDGFGAARDF